MVNMENTTTMKRTKGGRGQIRKSQANATWSELDESIEMEGSQSQSFEHFLSPPHAKTIAQSPNHALIPTYGIRGMMLFESRDIQPARSLPEGAVTVDRILSRKAKNELLSDNKLRELLEKLRTDHFVGTIDPEFHSPYLEAPDEIAPIPETLYRSHSVESLSDVSTTSEDRTCHFEGRVISRAQSVPVLPSPFLDEE
jgi:hypothetical protein